MSIEVNSRLGRLSKVSYLEPVQSIQPLAKTTMSKAERFSFIANRVCAKRAALVRLVECSDISPAQFLRLRRRLLRAA